MSKESSVATKESNRSKEIIMEGLIRKQDDLLDRLNSAYSTYKKSPKERITTSYVKARLDIIETMWESFTNTHADIVAGCSKTEKSKLVYFAEDVYSLFESAYLDYKTKLCDDMEGVKNITPILPTLQGRTIDANCEVKLPQIHLPKFSSGYEEWQTFHDMFDSLIHKNCNLSAVQKLHYLKSCLSGEAESLIKNLSTTDMNYNEAWSQLMQRYSNKRFNCNEVMKRLFSQKTICVESANSIKLILDTTSACLKSLANLGINTESWDAIINHLVLTKLDQETRKQWENQVSQLESHELPTWSQLKKFLENRFRTLEILDGGKSVTKYVQSNANTTPNVKFVSKPKSYHTTFNEKKEMSKNACLMCSGQHALYQCKQYANQTPQERSEYIQSKGLCFNCLSSNHNVKFCRHSSCCRRCGRRHHTTLHFERGPFQDSTNVESTSQEDQQGSTSKEQSNKDIGNKVVAHFTKESHLNRVLLATARVRITSPHGYSLIVRALIDQGSEASFLSEDIVQSLALKRVNVNGIVSGIGEGVTRTRGMVSFKLESLHNSNFSTPVNAYVLNNLTSFLPSQESFITNWRDTENLPLADPGYGEPAKIDVILGAEIHGEIITEGILKHPSSNGPIAQNTYLGWILSGKVASQMSSDNTHVASWHMQLKGADDLLKQFWEIEREPDTIVKKRTKEEMRCEQIFEENTVRDEKGRYVVRLPFKVADPECLKGRTREISLRRYKMLERKLLRNPVLYTEYSKVMQDYIEQQHMQKITDVEQVNDPNVVYLPHHAVIREDKQTTKIRSVFDASCKGINNVSLNDELLVGPKLQQDLRHILMRWRCHPVCIVADLVQMYRQIRVDDRDTDFQRIFWRCDPEKPIESYRLLRLTFGTACAPYLAVKCLQQLAKDEEKNYPTASRITLKDFYMDDLLTGCETEEEAIEIYKEMNKLMIAGSFELQKWCTNSEKLLKFIKEGKQRLDSSVVLKSNDTTKILGISWNKTTDKFEYTFKLPEVDEAATKRRVLSDIARIYDPMGWIAPIVITAKIFIQKLWKSGLSWDDKLTPELLQEWLIFREDLSRAQNVVIPRWLNMRKGDYVELHAFADASESAYAAVVFIKAQDEQGCVSVNLVTAKTKVAPVEKVISIPRMELCAAVLATKLVHEVAQVMEVPKENIFAWTDSTVVLAWIAKEPGHWTVFVSNRVSEILTILNRDQWSHVNTHDNPADCASRGIPFMDLIQHRLWWHGPEWLQENRVQLHTTYETTEEERHMKTLTAVIKSEEEFIWSKFSNLDRMLKVLSYCKRFLNLKLKKEQRRVFTKSMSAEETEDTLMKCIKETQIFHFGEEIKQLKSQGFVYKKSPLHTLCPIFDKNGVMRVGGRIHEARVEYNKKHPIIMPPVSHLTRLIINNAHYKTLHGGPQTMLNLLRSKYWIIRARQLVKKCYKGCTVCVRYSCKNNNPVMGRLPQDRVTPTRPFKITGVDFTGFINVRFSPGRGSKSYKAYVCLFVCMFSKAVHLEAVSDLSSQGFIAAFRRFVSRRGHCQILHSDNGTNFVGADKELKNMFNCAKSQLPDEIQHLLASDGTTWKFIPPHAPNFGGLWEAGVRSTKTHLKRVIGDSTLTFEELSTVLTQIEACLNSRPLSYLSDNLNDPMPLTPGHFLVGEPLIVIPDTNYCDENKITGIQRWKMTQKMVNSFWKKWSDEYLVTLNQRYKWSSNILEPELNDVVIIKDHNLPPAKWLLGRIIEKHTGQDNVTRVVSIKTKNGVCKRPCNKLCFLPRIKD